MNTVDINMVKELIRDFENDVEAGRMTIREALIEAYTMGVGDLESAALSHKRKVSDKNRTYFTAVGTRCIENLASEIREELQNE